MERTYEGMFLLDPTQSAQEWETVRKQVIEMLERRGGDVLYAKKWGERKLAYEIKGRKRGTYFLIYFQMAPSNLSILRRDMQLSELVLRNLILAHDKHFKLPETIENNSEQESPASEQSEETAQEPVKDDEQEEVVSE